jgi:hypothetical protein
MEGAKARPPAVPERQRQPADKLDHSGAIRYV